GADTITIAAHGFADGDQVEYFANGNTAITGLTDHAIYTVVKVDDASFQLKNSSGTLIQLSQDLVLGTHFFAKTSDVAGLTLVANDAAINTTTNALHIGTHGFNDGDKVIYSSNGGPAITGLTSGSSYIVVLVDGDHFKLKDSFGNII